MSNRLEFLQDSLLWTLFSECWVVWDANTQRSAKFIRVRECHPHMPPRNKDLRGARHALRRISRSEGTLEVSTLEVPPDVLTPIPLSSGLRSTWEHRSTTSQPASSESEVLQQMMYAHHLVVRSTMPGLGPHRPFSCEERKSQNPVWSHSTSPTKHRMQRSTGARDWASPGASRRPSFWSPEGLYSRFLEPTISRKTYSWAQKILSPNS